MSKRTVVSGLAAVLGASAMLLAGIPGSASAAEAGIQAVGNQYKNEKTELCLDSDGQGNVYTKDCAWDKHNAYQQWIVATIPPEWLNVFVVQNVQTNRCLETGSGDSMRTAPCTWSLSQQWTKTTYNGAWIIKNVENGRVLDSDHAGHAYTSTFGVGNPYMRWVQQ
ncbi:RICIN domain-containing protein [Streptomyces cuspidosporus]|uniref:Ricin B lectin domain-containing protein n=1 Tax=Streptomyces cuspidosporus TaxID=66882 RepID=A0ABP5SHU9_9ACTN